MKRPDIHLNLIGPTGDKERWTIRFAPLKRDRNGTVYGHTNWLKRVVTINSRLRNLKTIRMTLLHEMVHVTSGQNGSEELAANTEVNFQRAAATLGIE